jgi:tripartite-type tricarboxylate transporter receptor subunit TctC
MLRSTSMPRRRDTARRGSWLSLLLGALLLPTACVAQICLAQPCLAQAYPTRPIHVIVPFPPGGVADLIARPIAERLTKSLGQPVVVENRGGATGTLGASFVAQANPDGHTLLLGTTNEIAMSPTLYKSLPYDPTTAFAPVTPVAVFPNVLVVGMDVPAKTLADLIALAQEKPNMLTFGSSGAGSTNHLTLEIFQLEANVMIRHVPYRGGGPAVTDVFGGHITGMFATLPSAISLIETGKLRALAVTGPHRSEALPDVPTGAEAGMAGLVVTTWNGVLAPAGTPPEVIERLHQALAAAIADPALKQIFGALGAETELLSPQEFAIRIRDDFDRWSSVIKQAGISAQ